MTTDPKDAEIARLRMSLAAAEAGEDALAEALLDGAQGWTDMCTAALAAYEARRKG